MAVGSAAIQARGGQQNPLWGQFVGTQEIGGLAGSRGRAPVRPASRKQGWCIERSLRWPGIGHRQSQEVQLCKAAWGGALDVEMGRSASDWRLADDACLGRNAGYDRGLTDQTVSQLCNEGHLREAVEALGMLVQADCCIAKSVFQIVLKKCTLTKDLVLGRRVHALTVRKGYQSDTFLGNHILRMYAAHGRLRDAMDVFGMVGKPDAFTWSAVISAHVKAGEVHGAIELYHRMRRSGVKPDGHVLVAALQACARGSDLKSGQQVHADVLASGVAPDLFVCNCLVNMYVKCGSLADAQEVFDELDRKNVVTWTALIAGYSQQNMGQEALGLYDAMQEEGVAVPDSVTFVCLLQACASVGTQALEKGRQLHGQIMDGGYEDDLSVAGSLVNMYAKCGSLVDAQRVFDGLSRKEVVTWTALIAGYSQQGMGRDALRLYSAMQAEAIVTPNAVTFVCLLQACASVGASALEKGKQFHAQIREGGHEADVVVANSLVNMYAKCGSLGDAQSMFDRLVYKDVVTWNVMIAGYSLQGMGQQALQLYSVMQQEATVVPDSMTFLSLLQACARVGNGALEKGKQLHLQIRERGHQANVFIANSLISMYAQCGSLEDAQAVFDGLVQKDVVTWNAMIAGYSQQGMGHEALGLYSTMQNEGFVSPDSVTFVSLLQACSSVGTLALEEGKQLHSQIRQRDYETDVVVASSLVNMYAKCGSLEDARRVFNGLGQKGVITWNTMLAGYSQQGMGREALSLYTAMQEEGEAVPNAVTFVCLLQACASVGNQALEEGKRLHAQIREQGQQADVSVASSLVNMYAKCGSLDDARRVFDNLVQKDVVTWTALIAGYSQQYMGQEAICLYTAMQEQGIAVPDSVTFVCLLQACAGLGTPALEMGKKIHVQSKERGCQADVVVANSLVNMYAKCGSLADAQMVFDRLPHKDVVTWNAMIGGHSQQGMGQEALHLYSAMQEEAIAVPDSVTFTCLLQACASMGTSALEKGKELHVQIREGGHQADVFVANSLVNMYAQCGSLADAQRVFDGLCDKDSVTWTAIIAGYSKQGMGQEALRLYSDMQEEGIAVPNAVTFACLLQACANVAALHVGRQLHAEIEGRGFQPDLFLAGGLINMYGKCGSVVEAQKVFNSLQERDAVVWNSLIAGYTCQGNSEKVFDLVHKMKEDGIQPDGITFLSVLRVCSHAGLVDKGREYFRAMSRFQGITPTALHLTCMVDLLGRAGQLHEALDLALAMPVLADAAVWHSLLGACRKWSNVEVGRIAFDQAVKLDNKDAEAYVLMSTIYTGAQMWEETLKMQARRKHIRAWKQPGQSWWTDKDGLVHNFLVRDENHPRSQTKLDKVILGRSLGIS